MVEKITGSIFYVGANDHDLDLFEGQYIVPNGMAYNSYVIVDDKIAVFDTIDKSKTGEWLDNLAEVLGERTPDYLIVQHMEPDHSASINAFAEKYPKTAIVGNKKTFTMIEQFFPELDSVEKVEVKDGETLDLGSHKLTFVFAPMVHWPEVMMTYESTEKILFSADAFGKFGARDTDEDWACEARRYYFGIVGKYGAQVQTVLKRRKIFISKRSARCMVRSSKKIWDIISIFTINGPDTDRKQKESASATLPFMETRKKLRNCCGMSWQKTVWKPLR